MGQGGEVRGHQARVIFLRVDRPTFHNVLFRELKCLTMQRVRLGRRTDVATWGIPHTRHLADARRCRPTHQPPGTFDQAEPITSASVWSSSRRTGKGSRGEQGRRVSASRTTVLRDGAHVWRPRRAGCPLPHGKGLAAVGGEKCAQTNPASIPATTADSAQGRRQRVGRSRLAGRLRLNENPAQGMGSGAG